MRDQAWTRIAVMGAGAIGCYVGATLARAGRKVMLIGRARHVEAIEKDGLIFESSGRRERIAITATQDIAGVHDAQLVLFCVKSPDTEDVAQKMAASLVPEAVVLSLQNGVDNVDRIRLHIPNRTFPVLVYAAAEMPGPGWVRHTGGGSLVIGEAEETSNTARGQSLLDSIAEFFGAAGLPTKVSPEIRAELWSKLVMNCAYNAISALTGARYGEMAAMPEIRDVMQGVVMEVVRVARAKAVRLPDDIVEAAFRLADAMPQTTSSTAQDILKRKRTEIDHLNGYVVRQGEALGIPTPVNGALHALIKLLERAHLNSSI